MSPVFVNGTRLIQTENIGGAGVYRVFAVPESPAWLLIGGLCLMFAKISPIIPERRPAILSIRIGSMN
jgi:hypothetical protein